MHAGLVKASTPLGHTCEGARCTLYGVQQSSHKDFTTIDEWVVCLLEVIADHSFQLPPSAIFTPRTWSAGFLPYRKPLLPKFQTSIRVFGLCQAAFLCYQVYNVLICMSSRAILAMLRCTYQIESPADATPIAREVVSRHFLVFTVATSPTRGTGPLCPWL